MHEGCTAAGMIPSMHSSYGFGGGLFNESFYSHAQQQRQQRSPQQVQYLEHQILGHENFKPLLPIPAVSSAIHQAAAVEDGESAYMKLKPGCGSSVEGITAAGALHEVLESRVEAEIPGVTTPRILDRRTDDGYNEAGELGSVVRGGGPRRRLSWVHREEVEHRASQSSTGNCLVSTSYALPTLPVTGQILPLQSSPMASPAMPSSPEWKLPEPRSVLDLATSPPRMGDSAATPSYEFGAGSLGDGGLLVDDDLFTDFRQDSSVAATAAQLLGLGQDEDEAPPGTDWLQQRSQLWDFLIDDLTDDTPGAPSSLPRIDEEDDFRDGVCIASPSSSTACPSTSEFCHTSPSFSLEQSVERDGEEGSTSTKGRTADFVNVESGETLDGANRESSHELVNLLLGCAEAVSTKSLSLINPLFAQLGELASPKGTTMQRIAAYFTEGLAIRCIGLWPHIYQPLPENLDLSEEDNLSAFHILNQVCPYIKFAHFTANDIILQAFEGCDRVHVIDFDIQQGLQWPALFQSLAARPEGAPSHIRVTGIGENKDDLLDTSDRLAEFAEALNLPFEFHAVIDKLEDVRLWMLHVKEKETVAVNCVLQLHRALSDQENGIKDLLGLIASTKPKVVAVVEQEASHNGQLFEGRFLEALQYYAAIFDSVHSSLPPASKGRLKVERFFAQEIRNIVAYEGPDRTERHELTRRWRVHMNRGGFKSVPVSKRARTQAQLLLDLFACKSYTISKDDDDVLTLGWENCALFTASAWAL